MLNMIRDSHPELEVELDDHLKYIGYWLNDEEPFDYVDLTWDASERERVVKYLKEAGHMLYYWPTPAICKICGRRNGSRCLSDGTWVWPSGLAHYVSKHAIRLPEEFVDHVKGKSQPVPLDRLGEKKVRDLVKMVGGDPDKEVESLEKMRRYQPVLDSVRDMIRHRDLLAITHMQNIVKSTCALINYIGDDFDPVLMRGIVAIATGIASNEVPMWSKYVLEDAALVNLKLLSENLPPTGEYDS
jgi:hypothetical protein